MSPALPVTRSSQPIVAISKSAKLLKLLIVLMGFGLAIGELVNPLRLNPMLNFRGEGFAEPGDSTALRIAIHFTWISCIGISLLILVRPIPNQAPATRFQRSMWLTLLLFSCGPFISGLANAGSYGLPSYSLLFMPIIFSAAYFASAVPLAWFVKISKAMLLFYIYGSLLLALVWPDFALVDDAGGILSQFPYRLFGLAFHPASLGPMAVVFLLLDFCIPTRGFLRVPNRIAAVLTVLLVQSKTTIVLGLPCGVLLSLFRHKTQRSNNAQKLLVIGFAAAVVLACGFLITSEAGIISDSVVSGNFATMTGRTVVWPKMLALWEERPILGHGPNIWYTSWVDKNLDWGARNAHNQLLQALVDTGIVGLVAFFMYCVMLVRIGIKCARTTNGVSISLVVLMLGSALTSPVLNFYASGKAMSHFLFLHLIVFLFLIIAEGESSRPIIKTRLKKLDVRRITPSTSDENRPNVSPTTK